jgi:phage/plasmid-associated DNA primase
MTNKKIFKPTGRTKRLATLSSKTKQAKEAVLAELVQMPIVQIAVQRVGVSRSAYYEWRSEDQEFQAMSDKAIAAGERFINDVAESKLVGLIKDGNTTAIIYWLKNNHPKYSERELPDPEPRELPFDQQVEMVRAMKLMGYRELVRTNDIRRKRFLRSVEDEADRRQREINVRNGLPEDENLDEEEE